MCIRDRYWNRPPVCSQPLATRTPHCSPPKPALAPADQEKVAALAKALTERPGLKLSVPAVFNSAADEPALREAGLQGKLVAARKAELAAKKQPVDGVTFASLSADPEAYQKPWTMEKASELAYAKEEVGQYICAENNLDVVHMVGK